MFNNSKRDLRVVKKKGGGGLEGSSRKGCKGISKRE